MDTISVNKFRDNLKTVVDQIVSRHEPLKVTRRAGEAFVVISADDWGAGAGNPACSAEQQPDAANC